MEAILRQQCDYVGRQVHAAVRDMDEATWDARPLANGMTPRETLVHLCDVYRYVTEEAKGGHPKWDQYAGDGSLEEFDQLRNEAVTACLAAADPVELITDYIIVHDAYHVGQLCCMRKACDPAWDSHSIYGT